MTLFLFFEIERYLVSEKNYFLQNVITSRGRRGRDRMVVEFTATCDSHSHENVCRTNSSTCIHHQLHVTRCRISVIFAGDMAKQLARFMYISQ
jgi:hypothetical protein